MITLPPPPWQTREILYIENTERIRYVRPNAPSDMYLNDEEDNHSPTISYDDDHFSEASVVHVQHLDTPCAPSLKNACIIEHDLGSPVCPYGDDLPPKWKTSDSTNCEGIEIMYKYCRSQCSIEQELLPGIQSEPPPLLNLPKTLSEANNLLQKNKPIDHCGDPVTMSSSNRFLT